MQDTRVRVWDPVVRIFHWSLVIAFATAYLVEPEDSALAVHVWAGYAVGGLVLLRIVWGFVGSKHARFRDFAFGPLVATGYLGDLLRGKSKRYLGHSPAGAWMIYALLLGLIATVATGIVVLGADAHRGPMAGFFAAQETARQDAPSHERTADSPIREDSGEGAFEEYHEALANIVLVLVFLHLAGVLVSSFAHHENLARAMVTGRKAGLAPGEPAD